jgi:HEAT repeat protein
MSLVRNSAYEQKLAALESLRSAGDAGPETPRALRKALGDRNNYVVSKAAAIAATLGLNQLIPDLLAAYNRFFTDPTKTDPQCWAKNALSKALADLGHDDSATYLRVLRHIQMEPVWGGQADSAATLRGNCALALVSCRDLSDLDLLTYLTDVLVDPDKTVRAEAARAIGRLGSREAAIVLRLRALVGDAEPEVLGSCLSALLSIDPGHGIPFVASFLDRGGDPAAEAALALGLTHDARAFELLKDRLARERHPDVRTALVTAIALTRLPEALEMLVRLVETSAPDAATAVEALTSARLPDELRARLNAAIQNMRRQPPYP